MVAAAVILLSGCGPTCDSSDPRCITWTPPAEVQHRFFVECMQLAPPTEKNNSGETVVEACEDYSYRMASSSAGFPPSTKIDEYYQMICGINDN